MRVRKSRLPARATIGWLARLDGRSILARTASDRLAELTAHLGGDTEVSALEHSLLDRLIHTEMLAQRYEAEVRDGKLDDPAPFLAVVDRIVRLSLTLGLRRRARVALDMRQTLQQIERENREARGQPLESADAG